MSNRDENQNAERDKYKDIELLIDKKITEAKLLVTEKRLNYFLAIVAGVITIFGVILPYIQTQQSERRIDRSIQRMEDKFQELVGKQLRKPKIEVTIDGESLEKNKILTFDFGIDNSKRPLQKNILIKNIGDGTAENVSVKVYLSKDYPFDISPPGRPYYKYDQQYREFLNDEKGFEVVQNVLREPVKLAPKDALVIAFRLVGFRIEESKKLDVKNVDVILKIFYDEPFPVIIPFHVLIKRR